MLKVFDYTIIRNKENDLAIMVDASLWRASPTGWSFAEAGLTLFFEVGEPMVFSQFPPQSPWRSLYFASSAGPISKVREHA